MAARIALVLVSVLALGWLAVLRHDLDVGQAATRQLQLTASPSATPKLMERLKDAEFLNPDSTWQLYRASLWLSRDPREALNEAESLLREEPENTRAWGVVLAIARQAGDRRLAEHALSEWKRLDRFGVPEVPASQSSQSR
jgi:hypothetical protein